MSPETYSIDLSCYRLSPIGVGDSHFICGGCQYKIKLQIQLKVMLKLLKYPYVSPFRFRKEQPPDYPYVVLIWLINIITYYYNKYYKKTARILAVFLISLFNFCLPILLYVPLKHHQYCLIYLPSPVYFLNLYQIHNMNNCLYSYLSYVLYLRPQIH